MNDDGILTGGVLSSLGYYWGYISPLAAVAGLFVLYVVTLVIGLRLTEWLRRRWAVNQQSKQTSGSVPEHSAPQRGVFDLGERTSFDIMIFTRRLGYKGQPGSGIRRDRRRSARPGQGWRVRAWTLQALNVKGRRLSSGTSVICRMRSRTVTNWFGTWPRKRLPCSSTTTAL